MPEYIIEVKVWDSYSVNVSAPTADDAAKIACHIAESGYSIGGGRDVESIRLASSVEDDDYDPDAEEGWTYSDYDDYEID